MLYVMFIKNTFS